MRKIKITKGTNGIWILKSAQDMKSRMFYPAIYDKQNLILNIYLLNNYSDLELAILEARDYEIALMP